MAQEEERVRIMEWREKGIFSMRERLSLAESVNLRLKGEWEEDIK